MTKRRFVRRVLALGLPVVALSCGLVACGFLLGCDERDELPTAPGRLSGLIFFLPLADNTLIADGLSEMTLTAEIRSSDPDPNKLTVQFETTSGTLLGGAAATECMHADAASCITLDADRATLQASVRLRSSRDPISVNVYAILTKVGTPVEAKTTIQFVASGNDVLRFVDTASQGLADGATKISLTVKVDSRIELSEKIQLAADNDATFDGATGTVELEIAGDRLAKAKLVSLDRAESTEIVATVVGKDFPPARHTVSFSAAHPDSIRVASDSETVAIDGTASLTATYLRTTGSVTTGIQPSWSADKVDETGTVLASNVGTISEVTVINSGSNGERMSTARFQPEGLAAGDRVAITVSTGNGTSATVKLMIEAAGGGTGGPDG